MDHFQADSLESEQRHGLHPLLGRNALMILSARRNYNRALAERARFTQKATVADCVGGFVIAAGLWQNLIVRIVSGEETHVRLQR
jgi:hypothetical protein